MHPYQTMCARYSQGHDLELMMLRSGFVSLLMSEPQELDSYGASLRSSFRPSQYKRLT